jgi:hypothetical protein
MWPLAAKTGFRHKRLRRKFAAQFSFTMIALRQQAHGAA